MREEPAASHRDRPSNQSRARSCAQAVHALRDWNKRPSNRWRCSYELLEQRAVDDVDREPEHEA